MQSTSESPSHERYRTLRARHVLYKGMVGFGVGGVLPFLVTFPQIAGMLTAIWVVWSAVWIFAAGQVRSQIDEFDCPACHDKFGRPRREPDGYHCQSCGTIIAP